jgi:hypothetical protein
VSVLQRNWQIVLRDLQRNRTFRCSLLFSSSLWLFGCSSVTTVDLLPARATSATGGTTGNASAAGVGDPSGGASAGQGGTVNTGSVGTGGSVGQGGLVNGGATLGGASSGGGRAGQGDTAGVAGALGMPRLVNRYDFSGTGTTIVDLVGGKNGRAMGGAALDGSGQLTLAGGQDAYVALPSWLISSMTSVTIVAFITWHGGGAWQSVFNFGATDSGAPSEDVKAQFFFTPITSVGDGPSLHVEMTYGRGPLDFVNGSEHFPVDVPVVVASVFDGELGELSLYIDGSMIGEPDPTTQRLSELKDANCWLGQSEWEHDVTGSGNFRGSYDEFRIYAGALSAEQIQNLSLADPGAL